MVEAEYRSLTWADNIKDVMPHLKHTNPKREYSRWARDNELQELFLQCQQFLFSLSVRPEICCEMCFSQHELPASSWLPPSIRNISSSFEAASSTQWSQAHGTARPLPSRLRPTGPFPRPTVGTWEITAWKDCRSHGTCPALSKLSSRGSNAVPGVNRDGTSKPFHNLP